ncbi:DNA polymerase III subunit beta [Sinanaerobacter sp. ZZT-01]|uniref:DNA polymerase III subunit beta n=1 Tax=Sinanaerobacter sp. ZZT-01 TaxID=3111540 RepID=UPI002D79AFF6|nr:DNA polymerase III subunit beta [Sinanaerobacter sp. ZZT-01]WRR94766.1 DNA polymerase III subunit beta [Sinanaerobacter sp. ZZT-01]
MHFTCTQQTLSKALNTVSKAVTTRTTLPILKGILLETTGDNQLRLSASDLDLSIEKTITVSVSEPGAIVVSARLFSDIIRKLPNDTIEIHQMENNQILIRCMSSEFTIVGLPADEFPNIGIVLEQQSLFIEKEILKELIKKTSFAASIDESKGIIVGVLMDISLEQITMVALDGFRMAVNREKMDNKQEQRLVIAARILNEINKIMMDSEEETISMILDEKKAVITMQDTRIVLRLLEGEFIKYNDILPKNYNCRVILNRSDFLESIERASLLAKEGKNNLVKFSIEGESMEITSRSEEGTVRETVMIEKLGDNLEIGFNSKYVLDVLKVVTDEQIILQFNSSISPCVIKPVEGNAFEYLVLPVRIATN